MTKVWDEATELEGTALLVALCIADHAQDETGEAWPSIARIAHRVRRSERAVFRALDEIESAGWVERVQRPGQSTVYRMRTPDTSVTPADSAPLTPASPTPAVDVTPPLTPASPITIREPSLEPDAAGSPTQEVPVVEAAAAVTYVTRPFPTTAQRRLIDLGVTDGSPWQSAWATAVSLEWPDFAQMEADRFPEEHLALHLLAQAEQRRDPTASRWLRFYIEDRNRRIQIIAGQLEQEARMVETPQEREDRQNRALPPKWDTPSAETGEST